MLCNSCGIQIIGSPAFCKNCGSKIPVHSDGYINFYSILGIAIDSTPEQIKRTFRMMAHKHHPDKGGNTAKFNEVKEAYSFLMDDERRRRLDAKIRASSSSAKTQLDDVQNNTSKHKEEELKNNSTRVHNTSSNKQEIKISDKSTIIGIAIVILLPLVVLGMIYFYSKKESVVTTEVVEQNPVVENSNVSIQNDITSPDINDLGIPELTTSQHTPESTPCQSPLVFSSILNSCVTELQNDDYEKVDAWCKKSLPYSGRNNGGENSYSAMDLDVVVSARFGIEKVCSCIDGYHLISGFEPQCVKNCNSGECPNRDTCVEVPQYAVCDRDLMSDQVGGGWRCGADYIKKDNQCVNKVKILMSCWDKYGAHSEMNDTGDCICSYGYHLGRESKKFYGSEIHGPTTCMID